MGGRLFAIAGALIITAGVVLFSKYAWDQGWLNALSPRGKTLASASFGIVLLIAARVIQHKLGRVASIGAYAAGLGVLYATAFIAYAKFQLVPDPVGFTLFVSVSALGILISLSTRLASIASISLVGAYATPFFFLHVHSNPAVLPLYLISLIVLGIVMAGWKGGTFTRLRALVWWGNLLLGTLWVLHEGLESPLLAVFFLATSWALFHAELIFTSLHLSRAAIPQDRYNSSLAADIGARILASSFSLTSWATLLGVLVMSRWQTHLDWVAPGALFVATWMLAIPLGGHLRALRDTPRTDSERLAAALLTQSGALLIATIALGVGDWLSVVAWFALGIASALAGTWIRSRALHAYAIVVLVLSTIRMITLEWWLTGSAAGGMQLQGLYLTRWTVLVTALALAWIASAICFRRGAREQWRAISNTSVGVGLSLLVCALMHENNAPRSTLTVLLSGSLLLSLAGLLLRSIGIAGYALAVHMLATIALLTFEFWRATPELTPWGIAATAWTPLVLYGASVAIAQAVMARTQIIRGMHSFAMPIYSLVLGVMILMLSFVHEQAGAQAVTIAWLLLACLVRSGHRFEKRFALDVISLAVFASSILAWIYTYVLPGWDTWSSPLAMHPGLILSACTVACVVPATLRMRLASPDTIRRTLWSGALTGCWCLLFTSTSLEVARAASVLTSDPTSQKTFLSIWWGLIAVGLVAAGFKRRIPIVRHVGLALLSFAALKSVFHDFVELEQLWRVVSFLALGLLLLAVATVYGRLASQFDSSQEGHRELMGSNH
ncbi:MAG: DUF2339 domain-containing protein [Planctomycetota bacterium]